MFPSSIEVDAKGNNQPAELETSAESCSSPISIFASFTFYGGNRHVWSVTARCQRLTHRCHVCLRTRPHLIHQSRFVTISEKQKRAECSEGRPQLSHLCCSTPAAHQ
uniref:Uncharacterized protein n=1 Tax=Oreochromis aureus TaxID=47969 RepID=A0A668UYN5_OREAU